MKTIIKFAVFIVLSFTAVVAILNWDSVKLFAHTGKRVIEEKINEAQGMETKLSLLQTRIDGLDKEIYDLKSEMVRRKVDVEYMEKIVAEKELTLLNLEETLEKASVLLGMKKDFYTFGCRRYTYEDVVRDAGEKMKLLKIQKETIANLRRTLDTKKKTLTLAEENVVKSDSIKHELKAKVKYMKAQLERYKAKEVYAETIKADDTGVEFKTLIGQTQKMLAEFEKQLEVKDRLLDERIQLNGQYVGGIDYENNGQEDRPGDIAEEIVSYFKSKNKTEIAMDM